MVDLVADIKFPVWGLLPKQETGITSFLTKYPQYDGRDINIAIFDSGVDPGAPGLQVTSLGGCKVIERYDCSGSGDVDTSTLVKPDEEGYILGLTGRKLKIPPTWKNVNAEYHVGVKNAFELYPSKLKERIEAERREKLWDGIHKIAVAGVTRELQKIESSLSKKALNNLTDSEILTKEDYEGRLEYLNNIDKRFLDLGPVYDCVVYHDGDMWRACVDTSEEGNLADGLHLGEYSLSHEYGRLTVADQLTVSINIHKEGNTLEIVGLCSGHGTHVASIAAAFFPDSPEKNGVAPGAKIISLTIGDGRLGSMETGTALVRAMIKVMELHKTTPVHVINMSYGEHANWSNSGRVGELINEVVNKYGVVWVASAGNHGPALCTVGTPPDISQNTVIGVGAYVSPEMMVAEYSLRQKLPGMAYTWTSRGPTIDGDLGVSICAPGAAITSVPNFTLRNSQLLNGTSMASPHVAGAVAVLLSGLKQRSLPYSPYSVKRALEHGARYLDEVDRFAQGRGLLQIERSFDHLVNYYDCPASDVRFAISCGNNSKGIHIRSTLLTLPLEYCVNIDPCFRDSDDIKPEKKIQFNLHLALLCNDSFVQCPAFLDLQNLGRTITVRIDPSGLQSGVHYSSIEAYDVTCVEKGPLFSIPVTVVQPSVVQKRTPPEFHWKSVTFKPNVIKRHFVLIPEVATWGVLRLRSTEQSKQGRFIVHCMQIRPRQSCKSQEFQKMIQVTPNCDTVLAFPLKSNCILEVVVAKYWANIGEIELDYSLMLHGIKPDSPYITMQAIDGLHTVELRTLRSEEIAPVVTLKASVQPLRPIEAKLCPLTERDVIPVGRQIYELVLIYEFFVSKATEVVPNCPLLSEVLYESEFESQLWMIFDSNKQMLAAGDAYSNKYNVKLERGDYVVRLHVRHERKDLLEKLLDIPLLLSRKLPTSLSLDVYSSHSQAVIQGKKMISITGYKTNAIPVYISPVISDKTKIPAIQGQYLLGTITYTKDELGKKVDIYPFKFIPFDVSKKASVKTDRERNKLEEFKESLRDLKISFLSKLDVSEQTTALYKELITAHPENLAVYTTMMQGIDPLDIKKQLPLFAPPQILEQNQATYNTIVNIATTVINTIDVDKLLSYLAIKSDQRSDAQKIKSTMDRQKSALIDALSRKGIALCRLFLINKCSGTTSADNVSSLENIKNVWQELLKFVDPNDVKATASNVIYFALWHATVFEHYGRVLKFLTKLIDEKSTKEIEEKCSEVCVILGWEHCARYIDKSLLVKYPVAYRPF